MSKKRILYVEDDETLAFLTADNLEQHFDVTHVSNGKEAFELFCKENFDLCVLDIMLPDMDGFEIAQEIRNRNEEIPIIFISAKTMKEDRIKGLRLGADDYLVKPYSIEELILKIEIFLNRSQKKVEKSNKNHTIGTFTFEPTNYSLKNETQQITLTEREATLLNLFVENKNTVLKREKILTELWGNDDYFSGRSLDVFISRLRKIFKDETHVRIENIPRVGFKLVIE
ncbi:response regulator transcription factor [Flavobacterium haoranii]|uniref:DNA-binding response regulator, OmpR family, contains REC and winged-helix (WHTH) domain n=1 Tax=Flavobacterium haoranii TaxID=683124 RepID=A0A1M6EUX6_9FLAO|nr:response regulator transcription factor [Flavobacterium haoranii]SHI89281.1 DNA-binding response regulator, OmpR family, contains REC and winged-helix (wHTH) domain [Flavobacterium haoranii]